MIVFETAPKEALMVRQEDRPRPLDGCNRHLVARPDAGFSHPGRNRRIRATGM